MKFFGDFGGFSFFWASSELARISEDFFWRIEGTEIKFVGAGKRRLGYLFGICRRLGRGLSELEGLSGFFR
jgi:hypothetical protein